jgi:hypothetical protein
MVDFVNPAEPAQPVKTWRSREEYLDAAKRYMIDRFGTPGMLDSDERDRWYERFGMLVDFVESRLAPPIPE